MVHRRSVATSGRAAGGTEGFGAGPMVKVDTRSGETTTHDHGPGRVTMASAFVPRPDAAGEDDGRILSVVRDAGVNRAELVVLDAADITAAPVARVHLPRRVPFGFQQELDRRRRDRSQLTGRSLGAGDDVRSNSLREEHALSVM
ncbi:carotenoid oxygenase family protein [Actinacidiphila glaucinigra]|uniref:carotenoid oxygenase family protein n=1 Tax=Actinacidiphila glaucinigra TaxID=235986 RepID=UPI0037C4FA75